MKWSKTTDKVTESAIVPGQLKEACHDVKIENRCCKYKLSKAQFLPLPLLLELSRIVCYC